MQDLFVFQYIFINIRKTTDYACWNFNITRFAIHAFDRFG